MDKLLKLIVALYHSEINCGMETFWDGGITVWLGDYANGHKEDMLFEISDIESGKVAPHLFDAVKKHYPESGFCKRYATMEDIQ